MLDHGRIRAIALFFYFSYLDEQPALDSTRLVLKKLSKKLKTGQEAPTITSADAIRECYLEWNKEKKKRKPLQAAISFNAGWILPSGIDIGLWKQFVRESDEAESLVLILAKILQYDDLSVARGLGITEGTVRHRLQRALRRLGQLEVRGGLSNA